LVSSVFIYEKLFIGGDLHGHVGSNRIGFDGVHGVSGMGVGTKKGGCLNFVLDYDLIIVNMLFRKRVSHLITFSNG
jgi:hypothetical protein